VRDIDFFNHGLLSGGWRAPWVTGGFAAQRTGAWVLGKSVADLVEFAR